MKNLIEATEEQQLSYAFTALSILEIVWQQLTAHIDTPVNDLPKLIQQRNFSGPEAFQHEIMSVTAIHMTDAYTRAISRGVCQEYSLNRYEGYVVPMALEIILESELSHLSESEAWDTVMGLILSESIAA